MASILPTATYLVSFRILGSPLIVAGGLAVAAGLALTFVGAFRKEVRSSVAGLVFVAVAVISALVTGEARGYFLPGIFSHMAYAIVFVGSVLIRRPIAGVVLALLRDMAVSQFVSERRRAFNLITLMWSIKFAVVAGALGSLYAADTLDALFVTQTILGWPTNAVLLVATFWTLARFGSPREPTATD